MELSCSERRRSGAEAEQKRRATRRDGNLKLSKFRRKKYEQI